MTLASVVALFALVTLGGVVRITDSGLGCPDWPFCHGRILPATDSATLIEYSHRLLATVSGLLVVATAVVIWLCHRSERWLARPIILAIALLAVQVVLGGITVRAELNAGLVMAHLAVAEAMLAVMIIILVVAWHGQPTTALVPRPAPAHRQKARRSMLILVAVAATLGLILTGAYVQASGATVACGDSWPLCQGELLPDFRLAEIHMLHRFLSVFVGVAIVAASVQGWRLGTGQPFLRAAALLVVGLFVSQVIVGGFNVWIAFHQATNVLHLSMATAVWGALVYMAALAYPVPSALPGRSDAG